MVYPLCGVQDCPLKGASSAEECFHSEKLWNSHHMYETTAKFAMFSVFALALGLLGLFLSNLDLLLRLCLCLCVCVWFLSTFYSGYFVTVSFKFEVLLLTIVHQPQRHGCKMGSGFGSSSLCAFGTDNNAGTASIR